MISHRLHRSGYTTRQEEINNNTSPVYRGAKSLKVTYTQDWGALYLHSDTGVAGSSYDSIH